MRARRAGLVVLAGLCALAAPARAQVQSFTSRAAFLAALSEPATTLDFEAFAPGTLLPSGSSLGGGVSVTYTIDDGIGGFLTLAVVDDFLTTSGTRSLGLDDPDNENQLLLGDELDFALAGGSRAFGLTVITGDELFEGDVRLVTAQGEAVNGETIEEELADFGLVYFVGLIAPAPLTQVGLRYDPLAVEAAFFNIDDVTRVPAPGAGAGAGAAAAALAALRFRARTRAPARKETR